MCDNVQCPSRWRMRSKSITDRSAASPKIFRDQNIIQLQQVLSDTCPTDHHCRSADLSLSSSTTAISPLQMHRKYKTDTCIQPHNSVHNEENVVVSEVIELLIGSTYKLQLRHIETIAKEDLCMSEDLSNRKYVNFKCSKPSRTCEICIAFRKKLCSAYHLVHPINNEFVTNKKWIELIKQKFKGSNFELLSEQIAKYSSYDFELKLRNIFDENYHFMSVDEGHCYYKERLKNNSIMGSIIDTNYWSLLISEIMSRQNFPVEK